MQNHWNVQSFMLVWWLAGEVGTAVFRETVRSPQMEQWWFLIGKISDICYKWKSILTQSILVNYVRP